MKAITLAEVKRRLAGVPKDRQGAVVCALIGHSRIVTGCFGYVHCARCEAQIADQLGGSYGGAAESVRVGHNCATCRKNYRGMDWRDKFLAPNPFPKRTKEKADAPSA
jgi:hypothetical protein